MLRMLAALKSLTVLIQTAQTKLTDLNCLTKVAEDTHDEAKKAELYSVGVSDAMLALRQAIDEMEEIVIDGVLASAKIPRNVVYFLVGWFLCRARSALIKRLLLIRSLL